MREVAWSLPMAAAWIRWRDIDEVRRKWSAHIEPSTQWVDVSDRGDGSRHAVWPIKDRGYYEIDDFEGENEPLTSTKTEMLLALSSGRLQAGGYRGGGFIQIPAAEWTVLKLVGFSGMDDAPWIRNGIYKVMTPDGGRLAYDAVCVWSDQVLAAFPAQGRRAARSATILADQDAPAQCNSWKPRRIGGVNREKRLLRSIKNRFAFTNGASANTQRSRPRPRRQYKAASGSRTMPGN